ncbi:hypothetical protein PABG_12065 [Paracoccidioides brasiliensis Pb03]|nr:hypothetical protein PABG_12065 [Paracoccidioides brasiliensis Pb03]
MYAGPDEAVVAEGSVVEALLASVEEMGLVVNGVDVNADIDVDGDVGDDAVGAVVAMVAVVGKAEADPLRWLLLVRRRSLVEERGLEKLFVWGEERAGRPRAPTLHSATLRLFEEGVVKEKGREGEREEGRGREKGREREGGRGWDMGVKGARGPEVGLNKAKTRLGEA